MENYFGSLRKEWNIPYVLGTLDEKHGLDVQKEAAHSVSNMLW